MAKGLLSELRRRNVFRVAAAYAAIAWLALQVIDTLAGFITIPEWFGLYLLIGLVVGFPIAVFLAWAYELTPEGIQAAADVSVAELESRFGGRKLDFVIIGALALVIVLLVLSDRIVPPSRDIHGVPAVSKYTQLTRSRFVVPPMPSPYPIVPEGSRIYFNDFDLGRLGIRQVSQQGGAAVRLDTTVAGTDAQFILLPLAQDRSSLMMNRTGINAPGIPFELWSFPLVGGTPRLLGRAGDAAFSADGTLVAYESEFGVISVANADLSEPRELLRLRGRAHWIRFSPDGKRLRFNLHDSDVPFSFYPHLGLRNAIWEVDLDGGDPLPVLPEWNQVSHCCGVWTPNGSYYVFQATHNDRTQFWAVNESLNEPPVQITTSALDFRRPAISPDGKRIFAVSWQLRGEVARYDQRVESFVPVRGFEAISADQLSFSKDGQRVAYVTFPDGSLWQSNRDGTQARQLTFPPLRAAEPVWSPDGQRLAFVGHKSGGTVGVYIVSAEGGPATPIGDKSSAFPGWTADSGNIVFVQEDKQRLQSYDIHSGKSRTLPGTEGLIAPRLSPDGAKIAARTREGLVVLDLESSSRRIVTDDWIKLQWFYWDTDGNHLFLVDQFMRGNERTVWRLDIETGGMEEVAVIGNTPTAWSDVGMWVGIDPDGAPIVLKDTSIHHIYALDWLQ